MDHKSFSIVKSTLTFCTCEFEGFLSSVHGPAFRIFFFLVGGHWRINTISLSHSETTDSQEPRASTLRPSAWPSFTFPGRWSQILPEFYTKDLCWSHGFTAGCLIHGVSWARRRNLQAKNSKKYKAGSRKDNRKDSPPQGNFYYCVREGSGCTVGNWSSACLGVGKVGEKFLLHQSPVGSQESCGCDWLLFQWWLGESIIQQNWMSCACGWATGMNVFASMWLLLLFHFQLMTDIPSIQEPGSS